MSHHKYKQKSHTIQVYFKVPIRVWLVHRWTTLDWSNIVDFKAV